MRVRRSRWLILLCLFAAFALVVAACGSGGGDTADEPEPEADGDQPAGDVTLEGPIKLGALAPLSGPAGSVGTENGSRATRSTFSDSPARSTPSQKLAVPRRRDRGLSKKVRTSW